MSVVHATFVIEKTYPHPVEKVFAAFADQATKARWLTPPGTPQDGGGLESDFRVGGIERTHWIMGPTSPFPGAELSSESLYLDIVANDRIVSGSNMKMNGTPFSGSLLSFEFASDGAGTRLVCTHAGAFFENSDGPQMRENGWRHLLERLGEAL